VRYAGEAWACVGRSLRHNIELHIARSDPLVSGPRGSLWINAGRDSDAGPPDSVLDVITASGLLPAGMAVCLQRTRTELVWKSDMWFGDKALGLKDAVADVILYRPPAAELKVTPNIRLVTFVDQVSVAQVVTLGQFVIDAPNVVPKIEGICQRHSN